MAATTPAAIAVFGQELALPLIGHESTRLASIHYRVIRALKAADVDFEARLFGVPGGFALLTKPERIKQDGTPLPGQSRWSDALMSPMNVSEYLGRLFMNEAGWFRQIAFVITSEPLFTLGDGVLPDMWGGGVTLPEEIGEQTLTGRKCYALVYAWERRRGGSARVYHALSVESHLRRARILERFESDRKY